jgi:uncharacterized DUF497 family protein
MRISFDPVSRNLAFAASGLAFEDAAIVFEGRTLDMVEDGFDYPEERIRIITIAPRRVAWGGSSRWVTWRISW